MIRPAPRRDGGCWAGCARDAHPIDLSSLRSNEQAALLARSGHPLACHYHLELVEAELETQMERYRIRQEAA